MAFEFAEPVYPEGWTDEVLEPVAGDDEYAALLADVDLLFEGSEDTGPASSTPSAEEVVDEEAKAWLRHMMMWEGSRERQHRKGMLLEDTRLAAHQAEDRSRSRETAAMATEDKATQTAARVLKRKAVEAKAADHAEGIWQWHRDHDRSYMTWYRAKAMRLGLDEEGAFHLCLSKASWKTERLQSWIAED